MSTYLPNYTATKSLDGITLYEAMYDIKLISDISESLTAEAQPLIKDITKENYFPEQELLYIWALAKQVSLTDYTAPRLRDI
jgi:hypothetical protein